MTQKIQIFLTPIVLIITLFTFGLLAAITFPHASNAQQLRKSVQCGSGVDLDTSKNCTVQDQVAECRKNAPGNQAEKEAACPEPQSSLTQTIRTIINLLAAIVGAVSVIMLIVGGFRYVTSAGDSNNVSAAKRTILFAIVGLIIVAFAQVIVQFVLQRTAPPTP